MERWAGALRLIGLGWYVALCITLGLLAGIWLDSKVGVAPLFTLLGLALGLVAAFVGMYRMVAMVTEDNSNGNQEGS